METQRETGPLPQCGRGKDKTCFRSEATLFHLQTVLLLFISVYSSHVPTMSDSEGSSNITINMFFIRILLHASDGKTGKLGKCSVFNLIWNPRNLTETFGTTHTFALWKHLKEITITLMQSNHLRPEHHCENRVCFNLYMLFDCSLLHWDEFLLQKTFLK